MPFVFACWSPSRFCSSEWAVVAGGHRSRRAARTRRAQRIKPAATGCAWRGSTPGLPMTMRPSIDPMRPRPSTQVAPRRLHLPQARARISSSGIFRSFAISLVFRRDESWRGAAACHPGFAERSRCSAQPSQIPARSIPILIRSASLRTTLLGMRSERFSLTERVACMRVGSEASTGHNQR